MSSIPSAPGPRAPDEPGNRPRRGLPLLLSNAVDASGRQGADLAHDVLAVTILGATAAQMGLLNALGTLAFLVLGIPIGVLVDRSPTTRLILSAGLTRAGLLSTVVLAGLLDALSLPHLYVVAALAGTAGVVTETAQTAVVPRAVGTDRVASLVARLQSAESVIGLVVPAAAGALVAVLGAGPTLGLSTAFIALGAVIVLKLTVLPPVQTHQTDQDSRDEAATPARAFRRFFGEAREGWTTLREIRPLWRMTWGVMAINLGLASYSAIEVVLILRVLDLGPAVFGALVTAGALGGLTGSLVAVPSGTRLGVPAVLRASVLMLPPVAALTLVALADPGRAGLWLGAGTFLWGVVMVTYNVLLAGLAAELTPGALMGRVSATRRTLSMGVVPLGSIGGGLLADQAGSAPAVIAWVALNAVGAVLILTALSRPRAAEH